MGSNILNSVFVMVIGMVVVFVGLIILIALTTLMSRVLKRDRAEKPAKSAPVAAAPTDELPPEQIAAIAAIAAVSMEQDAQIVAAITAALMAYEAESGSGRHLVVRAVRRVPGASAWGSAGRQESIGY